MSTQTAVSERWTEIAGPSTPSAVRILLDEHKHNGDGHVEQLEDGHARPTKTSQSDAHANDPSRTTTIQRRYAQKIRGRFDDIRAEIRRGVGERDVLGLDDDGSATSISEILANASKDYHEEYYELLAEERYEDADNLIEQLADFAPEDLVPRDYDFARDADKHEAFMEWLRAQQEDGVLEVIDRGENRYIRSSYERGWKNATTWLDEDPIEADVARALQRPVHEDKLSLLFERNYEGLKGITDDVAREISRELAEGMSEGVGSDEMARRLADRVDKIGRTRATTLARTEVMHAHNESALTTYERIGDETDVQVLSEVSTAGDDHVCDQCSPWAGETLSIEDARSEGPPFHPRCRCILLPATNRNEGAIERIGAQAQTAS